MSLDREHIEQFKGLELLAKQVVQGFITGLHKSPFHGFSVEFAEHRQYNPGEDTRNIDWKLYGRSDRMYVKQYEEETNLRCRILMDVSGSMYYPERKKGQLYSKIEFASYCAASLVELLKKQRDAFGVQFFNNELLDWTDMGSTEGHQQVVYEALEKHLTSSQHTKSSSTALYQSMHEIADMASNRSLVIIFSDLFDVKPNQQAFIDALQHLRHNNHEVIVFNVLDKKTEINFEVQSRYLKLVDAESGEELKLHPNEVKKQYEAAAQQFVNDMKLTAGNWGVDFVPCDIQAPLNEVLSTFLSKRKKIL